MDFYGEFYKRNSTFNYRYNGKELVEDLDLGYYNFNNRFYDPKISRFLGVDPISDQFSHVSTFNYAENSPIANIDLWGLQAVPFGFATFTIDGYSAEDHKRAVEDHFEG